MQTQSNQVLLSYDGDDAANQPAPIPAAAPIPTTQPEEPDDGVIDIQTETAPYDPSETIDAQNGDESVVNGGQNTNGGSQWDDHQNNNLHARHVDSGPSHGTGIKEDG